MFRLAYCSSSKVLDGISYYQDKDLEVYSRKSNCYVKKKGEFND